MLLGTCRDGRSLAYDASLYEFTLAGKPATLSEVRALDAHALVSWRANELRDWLARIVPDDLEACRQRALIERNAASYDKLSAEERVLADAARDDSILAGKIVEADPALVHAVVNQLLEEGLLAQAAHPQTGGAQVGGARATQAGGAQAGEGDFNPLAVMDLPRGMEPLSQLERAKGPNRKMTRSEARLMRKILKADDKAKERREKREKHAPPETERERGQVQEQVQGEDSEAYERKGRR